MLDTFKARLKAKAKALGVNLSTKRIDAIADRLHKRNPDLTDDAEHDTRIDELHELQPLDEIAKADDRIRDLEAKAKGPAPKKKEPELAEDEDDDEAGDDDTKAGKAKGKKKPSDEPPPAWAKALMQTVETLAKDKTHSSIQSKISARLKDKVPEKFYNKRALPDSEDDLDAFIEDIENDWTDLQQEQTNEGLAKSGKPLGGGEHNAADHTTASDKNVRANVDKFFAKDKKETKTQN